MKKQPKNHSSSQRTTSPQHRSASPPPSDPSEHSDSNDSGFVLVSGTQKRERRQWSERRQGLHKDLRVMEYCLVLASDLMMELNTIEIIARNCYFGRYGTVQKVIISSKHTSYTAKSLHIQAFVTYHNERDTAFAIVALRDLRHHGFRMLKVHYGTSRYCPHFIDGKECHHSNCYFNHRLRDNHAHKDSLKATVEGQYQRAYEIIVDNLQYFVEKEYVEFKNKEKMQKEVNCHCGKNQETISFPSCKEVFKRLIEEGRINQQDYDAAKAKIKNKHQAQRQRCTSLQLQNKENKTTEAKQETSPNKKPQETTALSFTPPSSPPSLDISRDDIFPTLSLGKTLSLNSFQLPSELPSKHPKRVSETLQDYIERNIIQENDAPIKLRPLLAERASQQRPFLGEKMGELLGYFNCQSKGLNPELDACDYLISKIVKKTFSGSKLSRFQFAGWVDKKTQDCEQRKLRDIIGKKLIN